MCDERERLLDYLYDDCDVAERRQVEEHLAGCETCRAEIGGLRNVRQDLLAWDVPEHGSVWKPFAPPRTAPTWRDIPVWALAAAAMVIFMLGLAGGLAGRAFTAAPAAASSAAAAPVPIVQPLPRVTDAQMAALEQHILNVIQTRVDQKLQPLAAHQQQAAFGRSDRDELVRQIQTLIADSEGRQQQALNRVVSVWLRDSNSFVRRSDFQSLVNYQMPQRVQMEVAQALAQQGGR